MTIYEGSARWRQEREKAFLEASPQSLGELLSQAAERYGDAVAIDLFERGQRISYAAWDDQASRLANGFRGIGIRQGMHVGVVLPNIMAFPVTWMALARMGAVMVPINPRYTPTELHYVIENAEISHLVLEPQTLEKIDRIRDDTPGFDLDSLIVVGGEAPAGNGYAWQALLDGGASDFTPEKPVRRSDLASIQYTSGTTGFPKGCMQPHRYWLLCGFNQCVPPEIFSTGAILGEAPFFYLDALLMTARSLSHGATLHQAERMSISKQHDRLTGTGAEMAFAPVLSDEPTAEERRHDIKLFICVNGPRNVVEQTEERYGAPVRELYGMTEIGIALGVPYKLDDEDDAIIGTCGIPYPHYDAKIVDDQGHTCPAATPGELWVKGIGIMDGYWNNAEANAKSFVDGWFRTGDIFEKTPEGYFRYVGRIKDMIKRSGENISAVEVEAVIGQFPGIDEVAVIPVPHALRGEEVKAILTLRDGAAPDRFDYEGLHRHCEAHLAPFKIPRYVAITDAFDHTPSQKIIKTALIKDDTLTGNWDYTIDAPVEG